MNQKYPKIREGDLYEVLLVDGGTFEIRYGYYEEFERETMDPIPIYPDLDKTPIYGASGKRLVTYMQNPCQYFEPPNEEVEQCCGCCKYYPANGQMINACDHIKNKVVTLKENAEKA